MRKNIKKIFVSLLAATTIFTSSGPVLANKITVNMPYTIYQTVDKENISSGVVHEKIMKFTSTGWWNINVLRINLLDPYTNLKGLVNPEGMPKRDKISSLVEKHNAVAGINGDFFSPSPVPWALGPLISEGNLISLSREKNPLPGFFIDLLNQGKIDYFNTNIEALNIDTGNIININVVNNTISKDFQTITLLDKNWGPKSIGNQYHNDAVEVVVDNGIVVDIRFGKEAVDIPENGYVLLVRGARAQELITLGIGNRIELKVSSTPNINDIKFAIGGGSYILENGELRNPDTSSPGNHPRTGIGISQDGKEIILVTIDGRSNSYTGVTQEMFGAILKSLGAYNAINLDGGGSTTMAIKPLDSEKAVVVNSPSDGSERLVINGIGVFSNAPIGDLSYIKLSTDDNNMFVNTSRQIIVKGYDKYHNPVELDKSKLVFSLEGVKGSISSNIFKAESQGNAKITVKYENIMNSLDLKVLGPIKDLYTSSSDFNIEINSEKILPIFYGKDEFGQEAKIYPEDIEFSTINSIGHISNGIFYSESSPVAGILVAKKDDGLKNIIVTVGHEGKLIEGFETLDNYKFTSYPNTVLGEINLSNDAKEGYSSLSLKYDFSNGENSRAAYLRFANGENIGLAIDGLPKKLGLWVNGDNTGGWLRGTIKDNKGNSHKIDFSKTVDWTGWQYVIADIPKNISYPIVLEDIYIVETDSLKKQSGEMLLDGLTAFYLPTLGNIILPTPSSFKDPKNIKTEIKENGFSFAVIMEPKGLNELVKYDANSKIKEKISKHKIAVFLNGVSEEFAKDLNNTKINAFGNYNKNKHKNVLFLNMNSQNGGIRATNSEQWISLINDLNNIEENNIVLLLSTPIFGKNGFKDSLEADLLHKKLVKAKENGKNIFVVHGGSSNASNLKDGIRYIELNTKELKNPEDIYNLGVIEFVVNDSDITYQINNLFEKPSIKVTP